jgi:hypothetical protein
MNSSLRNRPPSCLALGLVLLLVACGPAQAYGPDASSSGKNGGASSSGSSGGGSSGAGSSSGGPRDAGSGSGGSSSGGSGSGSSGGGSSDAGSSVGERKDAGNSGANDAGTGAGSDAATEGTGCTRALLKSSRDAYFQALEAHDPSSLSTASSVKFTENGTVRKLGEGFWTTAGAVKFKRSAYDVDTCMSVTESVVAEKSADIVFGLRLKLAGSQIAEVETIVVRSGDYFSNPSALTKSASDDWETPLQASAQPTRDALKKIVDVYFTQFPAGACDFASDCKRLENGFSPGGCSLGLSCSSSGSQGRSAMTPRLHVLDVEAGIAVGFTMFAGTYTDFHMFKVRDGEVHGVHAILAGASTSGW